MVEISDTEGCCLCYWETFQCVFFLHFLFSTTEGEEAPGSQTRGAAELDTDAGFHP